MKHITAAYPTLDTNKVVLKVDGAKGAWNAVKMTTRRLPFRDHRHRAENAQMKFGMKAKQQYLKIAKCRDRDLRDSLISKTETKFQDWLLQVPFPH